MGGRVCRTGSSCLSLCVVAAPGFAKKFNKIAHLALGPCFASGDPNVIRITCVRASATSRAASSASIHASQSKDNSAPANEASPFALLVGTVAPKDGVKDAKASQKDNSQDSKDPSGDKSAMDTGSQQDANTTQNVSQPPAKSAAKTDKTEKSNNEKQEVLAETDEETPDESQVAAATLQLLSLQNLPPQPPVQAPVANPSSDSNDDLTVGAAAPAAQTA